MATFDDIRQIVRKLSGVTEGVEGHRGGVAWRTKTGGFVWERPPGKRDLEQLADAGRTWPEEVVIGVRVHDLAAKEELIAAFPEVIFTIPHFDGYPAVLVRLDAIDPGLLREIVEDAWLTRVSARVAAQWRADHQHH